jgi:hypothetical protein
MEVDQNEHISIRDAMFGQGRRDEFWRTRKPREPKAAPDERRAGSGTKSIAAHAHRCVS